MAGAALELRLAGPSRRARRPVADDRVASVADLPPGAVDEDARAYATTVPLAGARARTIRIRPGGRRRARVDVLGPRLSEAGGKRVEQAVRTLLNLDEDLSGFYEFAASDPELSWAAAGGGRPHAPERHRVRGRREDDLHVGNNWSPRAGVPSRPDWKGERGVSNDPSEDALDVKRC
jgi:hypothetical protein